MKIFIVVLLLCFVGTVKLWSTYDESKHQFPKNDFSQIVTDIWKKLGLKNSIDEIGNHMRFAIRAGQAYKWKDFEHDWAFLKNNFGIRNLIFFMRQVTWPAIVNSCIQVIESASQVQTFLLKFLKNKLDDNIGKNARFHPWNLMMAQDAQEISFIIFIYSVAFSLILIKILSWWNFMVYLAFGFIAYSVGGPYLVFKWLLCITGLFWFLFDTLLTYPLQVAILIIVVFVLSYVKYLLPKQKKINQNAQRRTVRHSTNNSNVLSNKETAEFHQLKSRLDGMEQKTDYLQQKLEELSKTMERVLSDAEDD